MVQGRKDSQNSVQMRTILVCIGLAAATFIAYEQVRNSDFVTYDDDEYVTNNPQVLNGLSGRSLAWAFETWHAANWHPLTWLSHMLDCTLFGPGPRGPHIVNVLFHAANVILLFLILKSMTGCLWRSAFAAALFALHPLCVESVAWVAERKNVLSTFLGFMTIAAYVWYARRPGVLRYSLVVLFFAAGLMAKPMLVTLPFVLLLLDYWPLGRFPRPSSAADNPGLPATGSALRFGAGAIVAEKLPFILMTAASCIVTYMAQQQGGAVADIAGIPFGLRSANALISYVGYIGKLLYPSSLAVFYPLRAQVSPPLWQPLASLLMIAVMSLLVLSGAARRRYLAVGWFWYLGMLVPVIGLVQVGGQSMADRYVYLPAIGIFVMCIWAIADFVSRLRYGKVVAAFAGGMVLAALLVCTRAQVRHWKDSASLYTHALAVTTDNWVMHNNYGEFLRARGDLGEAVPHLQEAIRIYPAYAKAHNNLGCALRQKGQLPEAAAELKIAIEISPDYAKAHNNYGVVLSEMKLYDKAIEHYTRALTIDPYYSGAARNLYTAGVESGKLDAAAAAFRSLTDKGKGAADLYYGIAMIDMMQGRFAAAADNLRQVLRMQPRNIDAMGTLAYMLATCPDVGVRRPPEAVSLAEKACELTGYERPELIDLLSQAYAAAGRLDMAQQTADKAAALALSQGKTALAEQIKARIQSYEGMQPK